MRREPNKKQAGAFMLIGVFVLAGIMGYFAEKNIFTNERNIVVMFFEESINGLNVGSPVVFKGVEVGKVAKIDLIADENVLDFKIPVYVKMEKQGIKALGKYETKQMLLDALIEKGLRARLATQSYVTGQLMIELEMLPDTTIVRHSEIAGKYMEIPTTLSPMGALSKGLQSLPVRQSVEKFNMFFDNLNNEMPRIKQIIKKADALVSGNKQATGDVIANFNKAMISITEAAKSFRNFSDYLERHPEALFKGKGSY